MGDYGWGMSEHQESCQSHGFKVNYDRMLLQKVADDIQHFEGKVNTLVIDTKTLENLANPLHDILVGINQGALGVFKEELLEEFDTDVDRTEKTLELVARIDDILY